MMKFRVGLAVALVVGVTPLDASPVWAADPTPSQNGRTLEAQLEDIHKEARESHAKKSFADVERLRLERRRIIAESSGSGPWRKGLAAINEATGAVGRMQYQQACKLLESAWQPFASMSNRQVVFGDVAMELFLANEAARMVDPDKTPIASEKVKEYLRRAASDDPCQVEVAAALAFLTPPSANEAMRRMDDRRFVRDRNEMLLAIQRSPDESLGVLPWHAPVEYLLAKSSSFVLGDLDYLGSFFRSEKRMTGINRHGETWSLVLGGGILVSTTEKRPEGVRPVFQLDSYDKTDGIWRRFGPEIIVVSSAASKSATGVWELGVGDVRQRLVAFAPSLEQEWQNGAVKRLERIVSDLGRPDVTAGVQKIRDGMWPNGPKANAPIEEVLECVKKELNNLAQSATKRSAIQEATRARDAVADTLEKYAHAKGMLKRLAEAFTKEKGMNADELATLRAMVEDTEFVEFEQPPVPKRKDSAGLGGFGVESEPAPAPVGPKGYQLKSRAIDALNQAEFLAACKDFEASEAGFKFLQGPVTEQVNKIAGENSMPGARRTLALQVQEAITRLGGFFKDLASSGAPEGKDNAQLKLADFTAMKRELENAVDGCFGLDINAANCSSLAASAARLLERYNRVVAPVEDNELLLMRVGHADPVRSWQIGEVEWKFYDLAGLATPDAASLIDDFKPLVLAEKDLNTVGERLAKGADVSPAPALQRGSSPTRRLFVTSEGTLDLSLQPLDRPAVVVALVERSGEKAGLGPQAFADDQGRPALEAKDRGASRWMRLDVDNGKLVVDYPGLEGHIPIGIVPEPEKVDRYIVDRRGYRITEVPDGGPLLFDMVAANGEKISGGYHSIADLVDIDRNIVNSFLPAATLYGPSLPAWQVYREQLHRWSPDPRRVRWALPRPAFRVNP